MATAIFSSETSVDIQRTTRRYIPEDGTLHNHRCENLKSYERTEIHVYTVKDAAEVFKNILCSYSKLKCILPSRGSEQVRVAVIT
jgi:hypothetical protein